MSKLVARQHWRLTIRLRHATRTRSWHCVECGKRGHGADSCPNTPAHLRDYYAQTRRASGCPEYLEECR